MFNNTYMIAPYNYFIIMMMQFTTVWKIFVSKVKGESQGKFLYTIAVLLRDS